MLDKVAQQSSPDAVDVVDVVALVTWLAEAATAVHGPAAEADKLRWTVDQARRLTGAAFAAVASFEEGRPRLLALEGAPANDVVRLAQDHLADIIEAAITSRDRADETARAAAERERAARGRRARIRDRWGSELALPIVAANGTLHGALLLGHREAGFFDDLKQLTARALAAHLAIALDNASTLARLSELEAVQREAAHQLQLAVLPPVPAVEGADLGRFYLAAGPTSVTGGDLYDCVVLPGGDLHIAVVDVMGEGVGATKDALAVTHALRLLVLEGCPLDEVVARANRLVTLQNAQVVATVVVARFSPETGVCRIAGAGHPPPLLVSAEGEVVEIAAGGVPIGWPGAGSPNVVEVELGRSETLVFYTDGLVEATKDILSGLTTLAGAARDTAKYPAPQMARSLVERALAGAERRDDALAVVLRRRLPPVGSDELQLRPFEHRFSANPVMVSLARHLLLDWLERQPIDPAAIEDLLIVASELSSNAIQASTGEPRALALRATADGDAIVIEMEDDGPGFALPDFDDEDVPDLLMEHGRGLFLVHVLTDELEVGRVAGRTVVRCVKRAVLGGRTAASQRPPGERLSSPS
jgi:serine phosphatase RsbU (regulator of sigma subunit)/anti-sigma regulatory factor (Ser/Thr protein kinase)